MRKLLLTAVALLGGASVAMAQSIQIYQNGSVVAEYDAAAVEKIVFAPAGDELPDPDPSLTYLENGATLPSSITSQINLRAGNTYKVSGACSVESGATLNVEAGVTIEAVGGDAVVDYILVKQGAKINAVGNATYPIIMTSSDKTPGAWGGIHICGYATTNIGTGVSEIGEAAYGGSNDADNSGVLSYVRIEYAGYKFTSEKEANGFTFYGVGSGTQVDHCEAYKGTDDGFEWFGGTVGGSYLISVNNSDDSFDWTEGWRGTVTNMLAVQDDPDVLGYDCDCLIEADNNENDYKATPISHPTLKNLVLVGNGANSENQNGIRIRRGSYVTIDNAKACGKTNALRFESDETDASLVAGTSKVTNTTVSGLKIVTNYTQAMFTADGTGNTVDSTLTMTKDEAFAACDWAVGNWVVK